MFSAFKESFHFQTVCCLVTRPHSVHLLPLLLLDVFAFFLGLCPDATTTGQHFNTARELLESLRVLVVARATAVAAVACCSHCCCCWISLHEKY